MIRHIFNLVQDAHLEGRTPISKIQDVTEIRFKRKFGWASEERKTQRFVSSGGLPKNENPKIHDRVGFRVPKNGKIPRFDLVGFRRKENQETKIRKIGWASEERKPKDSFGWASEERKPKDSFGWASEERKPKDKDSFIRSGGVGFRPSGKEEPRFDRVGF
ncbi:unnamed protein product [Rhizophagus irregularis]|uniref:Uncharacterized protein n=1 Tax=Rhizophagus irregularis TaxID=588596 RepID=A0A915ZY13_9GLOM|nr:unnamed protein product [Rhizophagus irregularis]